MHNVKRTRLTQTGIEAVLDHAETLHAELFITLAFETGARLDELPESALPILYSATWKTLTLAPNTELERMVPLVRCLPLLQEWLDKHPDEGISPAIVNWVLGWLLPTEPVDERGVWAMFLGLLENQL